MKALCANLGAYSYDGGIERYCRHLHDALTRLDAAPTTISLWDRPEDIADEARSKGAVYLGCTRSRTAFLRLFLATVRRERPEHVMLTHVLFLPLIPLIRILSRGSRISVFGYGTEVWRPLWPWRRALLRNADCVAAISRFTAGKIADAQGTSADRIKLCEPGLDPAFSDAPLPAGADEPDLPSGLRLLMVSRMKPGDVELKGVPAVIRAMPMALRRRPDLQCLIAGGGPALQPLRALAQEQGVADRVHFLGRVSDAALRGCYRRCHVFAMPSTAEGFGLAYLEAMWHGLPVIAGDGDAAGEVVPHNEAGILVDAERPEKIAEAIVLLCDDPVLRKRLGENGRRRVLERYTYEHFVERVAGLLGMRVPPQVAGGGAPRDAKVRTEPAQARSA